MAQEYLRRQQAVAASSAPVDWEEGMSGIRLWSLRDYEERSEAQVQCPCTHPVEFPICERNRPPEKGRPRFAIQTFHRDLKPAAAGNGRNGHPSKFTEWSTRRREKRIWVQTYVTRLRQHRSTDAHYLVHVLQLSFQRKCFLKEEDARQ